MSDLWRNGRVVQLEGAGHQVHYDRLEPFVEAVQAFLGEIWAEPCSTFVRGIGNCPA